MNAHQETSGCAIVLLIIIVICIIGYAKNQESKTEVNQQTSINEMKTKYRDLKFKSIEDETNWIRSLTNVTVLNFEDRQQDLTELMIDEEGVILQVSAHGRIYLDGKVDLNKLTVGHPVDIKLYQQYEYKTYPGLVLESKGEF